MTDNLADILLVTADEALVEAVRRARPAHARIEHVPAAELRRRAPCRAFEAWFDLDHAEPPLIPLVECQRRVYFRTDPQRPLANLPPGLFIQKPPSPTVLQLLWAGVTLHDEDADLPPEISRADLPGWVADLHEINLRPLCRRLVTVLPRRLGFSDVSLYLFDDQNDLLTLAETSHQRAIDLSVSLQLDQDRPMLAAARSRAPLISLNGAPAASLRDTPLPGATYTDDACVILPLTCDDELVGVLNLSGRTPNAPEFVTLPLDDIAAFAGRALRHARLFERAHADARLDAMTGLANFRAFRESLDSETARAHRFNTPLSLIALDLDGMKAVNDRFGHPAGDAVLRTIANRVGLALRQFDIASRVGGDEFAVILPGTDLAGARSVALRILDAIRRDPPQFQRIPLAISASLGVAQLEPGWQPDDFVAAADDSMYAAKRQGRDRAICRARDSENSGTSTPSTARSAQSKIQNPKSKIPDPPGSTSPEYSCGSAARG